MYLKYPCFFIERLKFNNNVQWQLYDKVVVNTHNKA